MKRYCSSCGTANEVDGQRPGEPLRCAACGAALPESAADDVTEPGHTREIVMGVGSAIAAPAETVAAAAGADPQSKLLTDPGMDIEATLALARGPDGDTTPVGRAADPHAARGAAPLDVEQLRERLGGRFEIEGLLGAGGMGQVFAARDRTLERKVALKCIGTEFSANREWIQQLRAEARMMARVQHPGIVQVHEIIELDGHPVLVLEHVDGTDLRSALRAGEIDRRTAVRLFIEVCEAVAFAHARGVIHRDIKPGNVMVALEGRAKVMDFGIAGITGDRRDVGNGGGESTTMAGSLAYMAPELLDGSDAWGVASDVYAIGVSLYYAIAGRLPFRGARGAALASLIRNRQPVSPRSIDRAIDPDLEAICLKAMAKSPPERYASAEDLADDLRRYSRGLPVAARRYPPLTQIGRALLQRPRSFALALLAVIALFGGIYFSGNLVHKVSEAAVVGELEDKIRNVAYAITVLIPASQIAEVTDAAVPQSGALDSAIRKIKSFNPDIRDAYVVVPGSSPGDFLVRAAWHGNDAGKDRATARPHGHDSWGDSVRVDNADAVAFMQRALAGRILVQHEVDTHASAGNEWQQRLLGYAPMHDADGTAAVLVIEVTSDAMNKAFVGVERAFRVTLLFGAVLSVSLLGMSVGALVLAWRQSR